MTFVFFCSFDEFGDVCVFVKGEEAGLSKNVKMSIS